MKPLDFSCILRLAKSQLQENGFKDSVIDRIYGLMLEYTANESHSIAFPDIMLLAVMQVDMIRIMFYIYFCVCALSGHMAHLQNLYA